MKTSNIRNIQTKVTVATVATKHCNITKPTIMCAIICLLAQEQAIHINFTAKLLECIARAASHGGCQEFARDQAKKKE